MQAVHKISYFMEFYKNTQLLKEIENHRLKIANFHELFFAR